MRPQAIFGSRNGSPLFGALLMILAAAAAGVGTAVLPSSKLHAQGECPKQACDTEYNVCFNTDLAYSCSGDPCKSTQCNKVE